MYILDTDTFSLQLHGQGRVTACVAAAEAAGERVAISVVTRAEVLKGRFEYLLKAADKMHWLRAYDFLVRTEERLAKVAVIPVTETAADHFDRLRAERKRKKKGHADLLIACIALAHDATLVTRNVKDFRNVPNLKVENWAD
ncbi:MAG TPA: type II toxin-antitoxin system VapC family toxin [Fimbriiglobus sp.]|nr:type II toxin-antitoxin system VapC family toxin [Fimbriiglobus sp.]